MARCFCACHEFPGVYRAEPCSICGHEHSKGRMVGGIRDGWEPNEPALPAAVREALVAADSILSLLYWREQTAIRALDPHYVELLDEALRKVQRFSRSRPMEAR